MLITIIMYESIQKRLSEELDEVKSSGRFKNERIRQKFNEFIS